MTHCIILAAGFGTRFHGDKQNALIDGKPMYRHLLDRLLILQGEGLCDVRIVSRTGVLRDCPIPVVENPDAAEGIASSMRRGLADLPEDGAPVAFFVADQPHLSLSTLREFLSAQRSAGILCVSHDGIPGNPVRFDRKYENELMSIRGDVGGKAVVRRHPDEVTLLEVADRRELTDLDRNGEEET